MTLIYARRVLVAALIDHQRRDNGACICGWGTRPQDLGMSHAEHVALAYEHLTAVLGLVVNVSTRKEPHERHAHTRAGSATGEP